MYVWIIFQMKIRLARRFYDIMEKTELLITNILKSCKNIIILLNLEQLKGGTSFTLNVSVLDHSS